MHSTIVTGGQSLIDVAVQEFGSVAVLFDLADANELAITDALAAGQVLVVSDSTATQASIVAYFQARNQRINTGDDLPAASVDPHDFDFPDFDNQDFDTN